MRGKYLLSSEAELDAEIAKILSASDEDDDDDDVDQVHTSTPAHIPAPTPTLVPITKRLIVETEPEIPFSLPTSPLRWDPRRPYTDTYSPLPISPTSNSSGSASGPAGIRHTAASMTQQLSSSGARVDSSTSSSATNMSGIRSESSSFSVTIEGNKIARLTDVFHKILNVPTTTTRTTTTTNAASGNIPRPSSSTSSSSDRSYTTAAGGGGEGDLEFDKYMSAGGIGEL